MKLTYEQVQNLYKKHGYKFYDSGAYNVNLFGIRAGYKTVDEFDDFLGIAFRDESGNPNVIIAKATTKPGLYWLKKKMGNENGTFILAPGYYPHCWQIGEHKGYPALVQKGSPFVGWRDADQDGEFDICGETYTDVTGLNCHTTSFMSEVEKVGPYSAGCQVRENDIDHMIMMQIVRRSCELYGNSFSYALFVD